MRWHRATHGVLVGGQPLAVDGVPVPALWLLADEVRLTEPWVAAVVDGFGTGSWSCWRGADGDVRSPRVREHVRALGGFASIDGSGSGRYRYEQGDRSPAVYFDAGAIDEPDPAELVALLSPSTAYRSVGLVFAPDGTVELGAELAILLAAWQLGDELGRERAVLLSTFLGRTMAKGVAVVLVTTDAHTARGLVAFGAGAVVDLLAARLSAVGEDVGAERHQQLVAEGLHVPFAP